MFEGENRNRILEYFKALVSADDNGHGVRFWFCFVVEEECLRSIIRSPETQDEDRVWVTLINPCYSLGKCYPTRFYQEYFRLYFTELWWPMYIWVTLAFPCVYDRTRGWDDIVWFCGYA